MDEQKKRKQKEEKKMKKERSRKDTEGERERRSKHKMKTSNTYNRFICRPKTLANSYRLQFNHTGTNEDEEEARDAGNGDHLLEGREKDSEDKRRNSSLKKRTNEK